MLTSVAAQLLLELLYPRGSTLTLYLAPGFRPFSQICYDFYDRSRAHPLLDGETTSDAAQLPKDSDPQSFGKPRPSVSLLAITLGGLQQFPRIRRLSLNASTSGAIAVCLRRLE